MKRGFLRCVLLGCGLAFASRAQPLDYLVDQRHDWPNEFEAVHSIRALSPVQEFTPALGALDVVEIWTQDLGHPRTNGIGATLQVLVREETRDGNLIATSAPIELPNGWDGPSPFQFTNVVWLTPENRYAIELRVIEGDNWGVNSHGILFPPVYGRGRYFLGDTVTEASDMWFRTGLRVPAPEVRLDFPNALRWQGVPPLSYRVWSSVNLSDWTVAGTVSAATTNYAFTNLAIGEPRLFYRVTYP